jgi:hypothetical protein
LKPAAALAAVLLAVVAAGGGTLYAASKSLPDSPLYRIKLAAEETRLWFAFNDEAKADILLDQAETRVDEIMALVRKEKSIPSNVISALGSRTSRAVKRLEGDDEASPRLEKARRLAQDHEELLLALWEDVNPEARDRYASTLATLHNARLRLSQGPQAPRIRPQELALGILHVSGVAEPFTPGAWRIGDIQFSVDERTLGDSDIGGGRSATVIAARGTDGRLRALSLSVDRPPEDAHQAIISGLVEEVGEDKVKIAGQVVAITRDTILKLRLSPGQRVEIAASTMNGKTVATEVKPLPELEEEAIDLLSYVGTLESEASVAGETNRWLIGGESFVVTPATALDAQAGDLAVGARVRVEAQRHDGELRSKRIVVLATQAEANDVEMEGVFQGIVSRGLWRVAGMVVEAPDQDVPPVGTTIKVGGQRRGAGLLASKIIVLLRSDADDGLVKMGGLILKVDKEQWRVGIARVTISDETIVNGEPVVGARAIVWGRPGDKGSVEAVYIDVLDSRPFFSQSRLSEEP